MSEPTKNQARLIEELDRLREAAAKGWVYEVKLRVTYSQARPGTVGRWILEWQDPEAESAMERPKRKAAQP